jgi:hypothetical protein
MLFRPELLTYVWWDFDASDEEMLAKADLAHDIAILFSHRPADLYRALIYQKAVFHWRDEVLGSEHPMTLHTMSDLAQLYYLNGYWQKPRKWHQWLLEARIELLASVERCWEEAESLLNELLETSLRALGEREFKARLNLALMHWEQGQPSEAESILLRIADTTVREHGLGYSHAFTSFSDWARKWNREQRTEDAQGLLQICLNLQQRFLGPDHPDTLGSLERMARWKDVSKRLLAAAEHTQGSGEAMEQ